MRKYIRKPGYSEQGMTLVGLLVTVAILSVLAAAIGLNFGKYIDQGQTESYATEHKDIQTAVAAMLYESSTKQLDSAQTNISDMDLVTADSGALLLSSYLRGLNEDGMVATGCTYDFTVNGTVIQASTP